MCCMSGLFQLIASYTSSLRAYIPLQMCIVMDPIQQQLSCLPGQTIMRWDMILFINLMHASMIFMIIIISEGMCKNTGTFYCFNLVAIVVVSVYMFQAS
jgi:hypothetical protein